MRPRLARSDLPAQSVSPLGSLIWLLLGVGIPIIVVYLAITSDHSDGPASTYRMGPFVAFHNDGGQKVRLKRCVKICSPPDTSRWWEIESGRTEYIPLHRDSGVLVVLTPDERVIGCVSVPRGGSTVIRYVSRAVPCPRQEDLANGTQREVVRNPRESIY
jgi:hypothetical protein